MNRTRRAKESVYSSELFPFGVTEEEYRSWVLAHRDRRVSWRVTRRGAAVHLRARLLPEGSSPRNPVAEDAVPGDSVPEAAGTIAVHGWPLVCLSTLGRSEGNAMELWPNSAAAE